VGLLSTLFKWWTLENMENQGKARNYNPSLMKIPMIKIQTLKKFTQSHKSWSSIQPLGKRWLTRMLRRFGRYSTLMVEFRKSFQ
jgi:hypothetical protein